MNPGAFVYTAGLLDAADVERIAELAREHSDQRVSIHETGKYSDVRWYQVDLDRSWDFVQTIFAELGVEEAELAAFYYLEPGAKLHPHRDLTGATLNNRIRFHVPIITNPGIEFVVNGERIVMKPGDLWCLDTSYLHSVENHSDASRVHVVIECDINEGIRRRLPQGMRARLHSAHYTGILAASMGRAVLVNSVKDPAYFRQQMGMVWKFVKWRILKIEKGH